jgi:hypothetical protein
MDSLEFLCDPMWLVKARIDGELHEVRYQSKEQAVEAASALAEDYRLSLEDVSIINPAEKGSRAKGGIRPPLTFCAERGNLLTTLNVETEKYANAASNLTRQIGVVLEPEYRRVRDHIEALRLGAEHAREAYRKHIREHGC